LHGVRTKKGIQGNFGTRNRDKILIENFFGKFIACLNRPRSKLKKMDSLTEFTVGGIFLI